MPLVLPPAPDSQRVSVATGRLSTGCQGMTEDEQTEVWIAAAQRGDRLALAKLLTTCHPRLRAQAEARLKAATKIRTSPEDVLQEVYLDVARQIRQFENRGPGSFLKWIQAILDHKLTDAWRAAHCQARDINREAAIRGAATDSHGDLLDILYADSGTPSRVARRQEAVGALLSCLPELSDDHREVIQLRFLKGLAVAEVAARLSRSEAAVVALTKRALNALRESMDRLGDFTRIG